MVTTIGIDPHKATHTAVAINETETVLGEITVPADRYQTKKLIDWAAELDGDGCLWAVEAAGGLGYLLSQQLIAGGEQVVDVPAVLASRRGAISSRLGVIWAPAVTVSRETWPVRRRRVRRGVPEAGVLAASCHRTEPEYASGRPV